MDTGCPSMSLARDLGLQGKKLWLKIPRATMAGKEYMSILCCDFYCLLKQGYSVAHLETTSCICHRNCPFDHTMTITTPCSDYLTWLSHCRICEGPERFLGQGHPNTLAGYNAIRMKSNSEKLEKLSQIFRRKCNKEK